MTQDLYYIEAGYYDTGYFVYTADAEAAVTSTTSISCDASVIAGGVAVFASGSWTSDSTVTAIANVNKLSEASITSQSTVSISITRIQEASAAFTSAFSPSLTVEVFKNSFAVLDVPSTLSATPAINRSITQTLDTIASLNAMAEKLHGFTVSIDSTVSFTANASKITGGVAELNSQFTLDSITNPIIDFSASLESQATQTSTATKVILSSSSLELQSSLVFNGGKLQTVSAQFLSRSSVFVSRKYQRPLDLINSTGVFNTTSKFGSHSFVPNGFQARTRENKSLGVNANQDYAIELYFNPGANPASSGSITANQTWELIYNGSTLRYRTFIPASPTLQVWDNITYTVTLPANTFSHIAVVRTGLTTSLFVNGVRGATVTMPAVYNFYIEPTLGHTLRIEGISSTQQNRSLFDETSMVVGTTYGFNATSSTLTVPTSPRTNDPLNTRFLYHFNDNRLDDTSIEQIGSALLVSVASISAQANGNTKQVVSPISATASIIVNATKVSDGDVLATASTNLAVNNLRIRFADIAVATEFTVTAVIGSIKQFVLGLESLFDPSIDIDAQLAGVALLENQFTQEATAVKTTDAVSTLEVSASQITTATITAGFASELSSNSTLSSTATRIQTVQAQLFSEFAITTNNSAIEQYDSTTSSEFTCTVIADKFVGYGVTALSEFASSTQAQRTRNVDAALSSTAIIAATVIRQQQGASELSSAFALTADIEKFSGLSLSIESEFSQTTQIIITGSAIIAFTGAFAPSITANVSAARGSDMQSTATLTAVVGKRVDLGLFSSGLDTTDGEYNLSGTPPIVGPAMDNGYVIQFWAKRDTVTQGDYEMNIITPPFLPRTGVYQILQFRNKQTVLFGGDVRLDHAVALFYPNDDDEPYPYWNNAVPQDTLWHHYLIRLTERVVGEGTATIYTLWRDGIQQAYTPTYFTVNRGIIASPGVRIGTRGEVRGFDGANFDGAMAQVWMGLVNDFDLTDFYNAGAQDLTGYGEPQVYNLLSEPWLGVNASENSVLTPATEPLYNAPITARATLTVIVTTAVFVVINASSTSSLGCVAVKTTDSTVTVIAQATFTAVATQTIGVISNQSVDSTLSAQVFRIQQGVSTQTAQTTVTATIGSIKPQSATLDTTAELTCDYTVILAIQGSAELSSEFTLTAAVNERQGFTVTPNSEFVLECEATVKPPIRITADLVSSATLSTDLTRVQAFAIALNSNFAQTTDAVKFRQMSVALNATTTQTALVGYKVDILALLQVQAFELTQADVINLDPALTYVIPQETRQLLILAESRLYEIAQETGEFAILPESRVYIIDAGSNELTILKG